MNYNPHVYLNPIKSHMHMSMMKSSLSLYEPLGKSQVLPAGHFALVGASSQDTGGDLDLEISWIHYEL